MARQRDELIPTRASLINRLKDLQDQAGWQTFFDTYWKLIYGVARKSGLTDCEAQDVVQETMALVVKHIPGFTYNPALGSFKRWLLNATRWRIADQLRKRGPMVELEPPASETNSPTCVDPIERMPDPASLNLDAFWEEEWEQTLLDAAIARVKRRMEPQKYQIFDLYVRQEFSAEKLAQLYDLSIEQVYLIKHRIIAAIKDEVSRLEKEIT